MSSCILASSRYSAARRAKRSYLALYFSLSSSSITRMPFSIMLCTSGITFLKPMILLTSLTVILGLI